MRQPAMALDRIDKIDRIAGTDVRNLSKPVNPVNPVKKAVGRGFAALRDVSATLNTKRREPRPRRAAIACGEPSPRLMGPCEWSAIPKLVNTERPAAGRRETTGSFASRNPVGFVARSPAGVWGEAPVQDSQTAGRKKSSLNARSASPATLPLPREAALCFSKNGRVPEMTCARGGCASRFVFARSAAPLRARRLCAKRQKGLLK